MTAHLTINGTMTCCGWRLGEIAADSYTTDPGLADCMECAEFLYRPQHGEAEEVAYSQGYSDGKEKGYFELEQWLPNEHSPGCGCRPCLVVGSMVRKLGFEEWLAKKGTTQGRLWNASMPSLAGLERHFVACLRQQKLMRLQRKHLRCNPGQVLALTTNSILCYY